MERFALIPFGIIVLVGCSAANKPVVNCSSVNAIPALNQAVHNALKDGTVQPAWGGVIDLLQDAGAPDASRRSRCTVSMDHVPPTTGQAADVTRLGLWTADHCLDFSVAQSAELHLFDPLNKKYVRMEIEIPELERFKQGLRLFEERARNASASDTTAAVDLEAFKVAGQRKSVLLEGAPIIERGAPLCQAETQTYKTSNPGSTVICSSVLDLARINVVVTSASAARAEVTDVLERLNAHLKSAEERKYLEARGTIPEIPTPSGTLLSDFNFFLTNWRKRVAEITRWRGLEAQSSLIEKIRSCAVADQSGICAQSFRDYFKDPIDEYKLWVKNDPSSSLRNYPKALHDEVYAEKSSNKFNLKWLIETQESLKQLVGYSGDSKLAVNLLRKINTAASAPLPTLGDSGALLFAHLSPRQLAPSNVQDPSALMIYKQKLMLLPYRLDSVAGMTVFMQPGDSGSVLSIGGNPVGVVVTVDGQETSGGSSVRPLPEYLEEPEEPLAPENKKSLAQISCK